MRILLHLLYNTCFILLKVEGETHQLRGRQHLGRALGPTATKASWLLFQINFEFKKGGDNEVQWLALLPFCVELSCACICFLGYLVSSNSPETQALASFQILNWL